MKLKDGRLDLFFSMERDVDDEGNVGAIVVRASCTHVIGGLANDSLVLDGRYEETVHVSGLSTFEDGHHLVTNYLKPIEFETFPDWRKALETRLISVFHSRLQELLDYVEPES